MGAFLFQNKFKINVDIVYTLVYNYVYTVKEVEMDKNILVRVDSSLREKSKKLAKAKGKTLSELVREFLEKEVKKNKI